MAPAKCNFPSLPPFENSALVMEMLPLDAGPFDGEFLGAPDASVFHLMVSNLLLDTSR